jgi:hypothetical protein
MLSLSVTSDRKNIQSYRRKLYEMVSKLKQLIYKENGTIILRIKQIVLAFCSSIEIPSNATILVMIDYT